MHACNVQVYKMVHDNASDGRTPLTYIMFMLQGSDYFSTELSRLERLLEGGKLSPTKLSEISRKISVLGAFKNDDESSSLTAEE